MNKPLDEVRSHELAEQVKSKAQTPFENAYRSALATKGSLYVQGFLVMAKRPRKPIEHGWIEVENGILDPNLPFLNSKVQDLYYFPAQYLTVKHLKAAVEEAKEDYPDDDPLPIYGTEPYEYYGDVMLGGKEYLEAFQAAQAWCGELMRSQSEQN
jgi:hypothetical protein